MIYITEDGKRFDNLKEATEHEQKEKIYAIILGTHLISTMYRNKIEAETAAKDCRGMVRVYTLK